MSVTASEMLEMGKRRRIGYLKQRLRTMPDIHLCRAKSRCKFKLLPRDGFAYTGAMHHKPARKITFPALAVALCAVLLAACEKSTQLEDIREAGSLRVITRNTPTTFYQDRNGDTGLEYELSKRFADSLNVELDIQSADTVESLYQQLSSSDGPDLAAAGLTVNPQRQEQIRFATPYLQVTPQVVYRRGSSKPRKLEDLYGQRLMVLKGSTLADELRGLQAEHPELEFEESDNVEVVDLLRMVNDDEIDAAVVYSNELVVNQAFYPAVSVAFDLGPEQPMAWALKQHADTTLLDAVSAFFAKIKDDGTLDQLIERFYGHSDVLDYVGARAFAEHMQSRLPRYESFLRQAGEQYGLDWRLLAAMAYQESLWDESARSATGVRGLMMLTLPTAKFVGVTNRVDPQQSIMGGARYLVWVRDQISTDIPEPDRTWFALASYNVGLGHLEDARKLTEKNGRDPNRWIDVKDFLPLLQKKQWYTQTRYGYARGSEPVHYVQNIRRYHDILQWVTQPQSESRQQSTGQYSAPGILEQLPEGI
ncbi:membrane-bound lytic murein transglycosylase MltF [Pseudomonas sp. 5Ae-yellow]|uniref:membrane-bound lytic murein transglycosylase MltF n=2 Tax=Pseudomonas TaxID=286 RepID=UPI0021756BA6|nr:membrane-bound lytic murein transglycosylase MltF [Pseudomonas sp. 5Ae-yellow]|tara:strand:+ start:4628 stop:6232 length:1605 start_codon:yes stop_codon:yes gene_type:complete